jgi:hypothetical protein
MSGSHKQFKYLYGVIYRDICFLMKIPKSKSKQASEELHEAFKTYADIDTLTDLDTRQMEWYLGMIRMLCARERGWLLALPHEPDYIVDMSMREFLNLIKEDHE